jgi:hypothetical protein
LRSQPRSKIFYIRRKKTNIENANIGLYIFDPEIDHPIDPEDKFT